MVKKSFFSSEQRQCQSYFWYLQIILLCLGQLLLIVGTLLFPKWMGIYIDQISDLNEVQAMAAQDSNILVKMILLVALLAIFTYVFNHLQVRFINRWLADLRNIGLAKMLKVDLQVQNRQKASDYSSRLIHDLDAFKEGLGMGVWQLPAQLLLLIGSLYYLGKMNVYLVVIVLILAPQCLWLSSLIARRSKKKYQQQQELQLQMLAMVDEEIAQPALLKSLGMSKAREAKYAHLNESLRQVGEKAQFYSSLMNPVARLIHHLSYIAVGICAVLLASGGKMTYGEIAAALSYTLLFSEPLNQISFVYGQLQKAFVSWQRYRTLLTWPDLPDQGKSEWNHFFADFKMKGISFSYDEKNLFLEDMNVLFPSGKMTAIVGGTGSGKTTLVHLLLRFYQPAAGAIYVGEQNMQEIAGAAFYQQIGFILQDAWLFQGTIAENIAYGLENVSLQEMKEAAEQACADTFIERLPGGYETVLGRDGYQLSQGQKQMLTLARVFLRKPPLLIFDEATSNVDVQTEQKIQASLRKLMEGRTSIIIAHRLATIQSADQIIVMDEGKIVEKGSHEELMSQNGYYARMYESQFH